ncbi:MAG: ribosome biogenesis GTPase Der [Christensenellales bacterium]|jgi:GTP-binding protein|nr:ribosome biogenesis GTPase Der [Clostridiales bacterium]
MIKPLVAIVGRPNVGKSTLFNRLAGKRISIVEDVPGVTRDRIYADCEWLNKTFTLIDTGGIELRSEDTMWMHIKQQVDLAVDLADVIVFIVDGKHGLTADDYDVAEFLRKTDKPIVLTVNKIDNQNMNTIYDFYQLGIGEPIPVSAIQGLNIGDLLDEIIKRLPQDKLNEEEEEGGAIKIAVVGKPNAGKSSIVNKILGFERTIVTDIAGTTRDAVDTPFTYKGKEYVIIDTSGLRKKSKVKDNVEYYSNVRSVDALRRADVVLIIIDSTEELSEQDIRICGMAHESHKPSIIVMNKWDLVEKDTYTVNKYNQRLSEELKFMDYYKAVYVSALTGKRVNAILDNVDEVYKNASQRISTGILNEVLHDAIAVNEPPTKNGVKLKIYYITQIGVRPPTFALFVNDSKIMHFSYKRYLENALRKAFDFSGTPIRIITKENKDY